MRIRILLGLDSLFRYHLWIGVTPLIGGLIALGIARLLWPGIPTEASIYGLAGMVLATGIGVIGLRTLKAFMHPWVIRRLAEESEVAAS
ncbi:MAG: hypothetical protein ACKVYV_17495 [Limisphaerales bacterium]